MPQVPNNVKFGVPLMFVSFAVFAIALFVGVELIKPEHKAAAENTQTDGGGGGGAGGPVNITIVAKNILFDKRTINANAGAPLTVHLDNQDAGIPHNISFYTTRAATTKLAPPESNPDITTASITLTFAPPRAGTFFYRCDAHPDQMTGSLVVR